MSRHLGCVTLIVEDYDSSIKYFTETLGFKLKTDLDQGSGKRWVVVSPSGEAQSGIVLAKEN
jgi:catechol 2,3-dioxygenase-like lactoylglutathione lyase family enzyme